MTILSDICTLGPYVLDINVLSPVVLADGDFILLSFDNDVSTIRFPKFQYLFTISCSSADCPYPGDYQETDNADLIISIEFQQRIRDQWRTYALSNFNYTAQRLMSYYPMSDSDVCPNTPTFEALLLWK